MTLSQLRNNPGAKKHTRRKGRGPGSGRGKTCGRGHRGQKARSGRMRTRGFEGGQMPFHRRLPKKGFSSTRFKTVYSVVNVVALNLFEDGATITPRVMRERGLVKNARLPVKILGDGELSVKVNVSAHAFSRKARQAIEQRGGTCNIIG